MQTLIIDFSEYDDIDLQTFVLDLTVTHKQAERITGGTVIGQGEIFGRKAKSLRAYAEKEFERKLKHLTFSEKMIKQQSKISESEWSEKDKSFWLSLANMSGNFQAPSDSYKYAKENLISLRKEIKFFQGLLR